MTVDYRFHLFSSYRLTHYQISVQTQLRTSYCTINTSLTIRYLLLFFITLHSTFISLLFFVSFFLPYIFFFFFLNNPPPPEFSPFPLPDPLPIPSSGRLWGRPPVGVGFFFFMPPMVPSSQGPTKPAGGAARHARGHARSHARSCV